jgi:NADPH-dependent ferric siderophore reductase
MTEPVPSPTGGDRTNDDFLRMPDVRLLRLRVVEIADTGTATRQLRLAGGDLAGFGYAPGQDLMFLVDTANGRIIRRRYSIRRLDPVQGSVDLHVVTDTSGPGAKWARDLRVGDEVEAIGPRGKITLAAGVDWHLFLGDDVAVPAISRMVEALPAGTRAIVVADVVAPEDETKIDPARPGDVDWTWRHRGHAPAGDPAPLLAAAAELDLPAGTGHAYVFAEAAVVNAVRDKLAERGFAPERMSPKAYWGRGRANASHGEPLK